MITDKITDKNVSEKTLRLIDYLSALAKINAKITRSLDDYRKILWIHNIPHEPKHCFTRAWGEEEEHEDAWIEVVKFKEPALPTIPARCQDWVNHDTLRNTKDLPELYETIIVERIEEDPETGQEFTVNETLYLENFEDVQKSWEAYLEKQWLPWTELYNRYAAVQKIYADLFHIYQEQQKLGEQYELVFCIGLLTWKTPTGHETKRHIITSTASLEFEPHLGRFTVKQAIDGDQVDIELDMLDIQVQPQNVRQLIEEGRNIMRANFWDRANIDAVLTSIANSLADSGQGEYHSDRLQPNRSSAGVKPLIEYAPALILRKRSMRGLEQLLASIKEQIINGVSIPDEFLDLCESLPDKDANCSSSASEDLGENGSSEIYFPLPANEEQRRIIRTLDKQKGVLVQGPPGTGKSHTIANLICHLLATGKRVLVTAKTPRALQVLHDKLPAEIKPLCINLLGHSTEERASLEKSVTGILARLDRRDEANHAYRIQLLENRISSNRSQKAETDNKTMALREAETFKHVVAGVYTGTAAQIARTLKQEEALYSWFTDDISPEDACPLSGDELSFLCAGILDTDQETERILQLLLPDPQKDLPDGAIIRAMFQKEALALVGAEAAKEILNSTEGKALLDAGAAQIALLLSCLSDLAVEASSVRQRPMPWIERAAYDVLTDRDTPWKELLKLSIRHSEGLHEIAVKVDAVDVSIPENMDRKKLLHDAEALKEHFASGGGTGVWVFKPKAVREHGALLGNVKVDGLECCSVDVLQTLIDYLTLEQRLDYIWSLWSGKADRQNGPFPIQLAEIAELHEALENIIGLCDKREKAREALQSVKGLSAPRWEDVNSLNSLIESCRIVLSHIDYLEIHNDLQKLENHLSALATRNNAHLINREICEAFQARDIESYCKLVEAAQELCRQAEAVNKKHQSIGKLAKVAPKLAANIASFSDTQQWSERLPQLDKAWAWAQGLTWLSDFLESDIESLERHSKRLEEEIRKDLSELAAVKAWQFCFSRMQEDHRRHLMSWQQSMKKLGKGTGKYAYTHRRNAQRHLSECRDAVPAWIMPLHRVYEAVDAGSGIFDVIIVDEASQCGPEALPLLYLGKRVLVVGDDKQISPEAIGTNREQVQQLMRNFLYDFTHADSFDVENSLFDHGRIRFSNRITLREHFRCMPEIIRFSNDLCYRSDPLIPLRQYPPDRIEPLKAVYVQDGYREGQFQRVINRPEAEAIVSSIEACCQDERYQGMTMGVIVLQGEAQAYLIESLLLQRLGAEEMESRKLICGNPYSFQGDERDVIFLSMVAAPNERIGALTQEADQRRFNVAASRAQDQMWLFYSATANHLSEHCFRRRLLEYFTNPMSRINQALGEDAEALIEKAYRANRTIEKAPAPFDSWFEVDVALHIAGQGHRVVPQFEFADKRIDLVVQGEKAQLAVECDGDFWHGPDEYVADTERQRKLERCGWQFYRVRESSYYAAPEKALGGLWDQLRRMGIKPLQSEPEDEFEDDENGFGEDDETLTEFETAQLFDDIDETVSSVSGSRGSPGISKAAEVPDDIQDALCVKADLIHIAIIKVLEGRPNFSCVKEKMPTYVLKMWNIRSRGKPREQFAKRVYQQISIMERKGYVIVYKSKNIRVKLGWVRYPDM